MDELSNCELVKRFSKLRIDEENVIFSSNIKEVIGSKKVISLRKVQKKYNSKLNSDSSEEYSEGYMFSEEEKEEDSNNKIIDKNKYYNNIIFGVLINKIHDENDFKFGEKLSIWKMNDFLPNVRKKQSDSLLFITGECLEKKFSSLENENKLNGMVVMLSNIELIHGEFYENFKNKFKKKKIKKKKSCGVFIR